LYPLKTIPMHSKPLRKNPVIVALSENNRQALALSSRIRKGIENGIDNKRISAYVLHVYRHFLKDQFLLEESMYSCLSDHNMLRIQACSEHALLTPLFERMNNRDFSHADLHKLATILEKHILFETENVFPYVESLNPNAHRKTVAEYQECWSDTFWTKN